MILNCYRLLDHTADLGVEIFGATPTELFVNAAHVLGDLLWEPGDASPHKVQTVAVEGDDWADLLINWLRELLYLWNGRHQIWRRVSVTELTANHLQAQVQTDSYVVGRDLLRHDIKAVTYHGIAVAPTSSGWQATVIFDV